MGWYLFDSGLFEILFVMMFVVILGMILTTAVQSLHRWNQNNNSPRLTVDAMVAAKRTQVGAHHHGTGASAHVSHYTHYFITFQVESGDRMELPVEDTDYGMLVEGDRGRLTFQGTRYLGFVRQ